MKKETKKEIGKCLKILLSEIGEKKVQMFDCYDLVGDYKEKLFENNEVEVLYAPGYEYVEIVGLSNEDYNYFFKKFGY